MNIFFYSFLFIFWTLFGSFASVIIYRLKSSEKGILFWRSHCKTCERNLSPWELFPIFSWLFQKWRCKGCKKKISIIYPLLEFTSGLLFLWVWYFLISPWLIFSWNIFEWWRMVFFLSIMFLTLIYVYYDILYLEIPESVLAAANIMSVLVLILQGYGFSIIPYLSTWNNSLITVWVCLLVLSSLYYIMLAGLKEIYDCLIVLWCILILWWYMYYAQLHYLNSALISGTIAALWIFISFFLQIVLSWWRAMWAWDLRIAILMWLLVGSSLAFPAWMICYLVWSIIWISILSFSILIKKEKKGFQHEVPFGPFIAIWYICILFFFPQIQSLLNWYL